MKKHKQDKNKHDKKLPPEAFSGNTQQAFDQEAPHKRLARGAMSKAAQQYKDGEIAPEEFDKHVGRAHNRLADYGGEPPVPVAMVVHHRKGKK